MERKQWVALIVVLAVLTVVYVGVLVFGVTKSDRTSSPDALKSSIAGTLQRLLGQFAPRIDGSRLYCNGQRLNSTFTLTGSRPSCKLDIPSKPGERYRKGTLQVTLPSAPVDIYVRSSPMSKSDTAGVDMSCVSSAAIQSRPRMEIIYRPAGKDEPDNICWIRQEPSAGASTSSIAVGLVVMEGGGNLDLNCRWCSGSSGRSVALRLQ